MAPTLPALRQTLPPEITGFFSGKGPKTLAIRGPPGAGKTTLALAILDGFEGRRAYVTGRVQRSALLRDHPWLAAPNPRAIEVVEDLRFRGGKGAGELSLGGLRDALQARASDLVELSMVMALPRGLEEMLGARPEEPKLVVIDSWESWIENTLGPTPLAVDVPTTHWELERSLLDRFRDAGAHVVLVVERQDPARMDYVTDGALSLTVTEEDGRAERWLTYQKLRGTRMQSISYPFTLEGGLFRSIQPTPVHAPPSLLPVQPDPGPTNPGAWPGSAAFATRFGRLGAPGPTLFEVDAETPMRLPWRLTLPAAVSALRSRGHVLLLPPASVSLDGIWEDLNQLVPAETLETGLRVLLSGPNAPSSKLPGRCTVRLDGALPPGSVGATFEELTASDFLRPPLDVGAHSLLLLYPDSPYGPGHQPDASAFSRVMEAAARPGAGVSIVIVALSTSPMIEALRSRASVHLLVHSSRGQYFLTGLRPWSPHFALALPLKEEQERLPYDLVPIV